jgi:hypothetical protein
MTPSLTLEAALTKCADDNDFTVVAIGRMPVGERVLWTASVHWEGHAAGGIACQHGDSEISIHEALCKAIEFAQLKRAPLAVVPMRLTVFSTEQMA